MVKYDVEICFELKEQRRDFEQTMQFNTIMERITKAFLKSKI